MTTSDVTLKMADGQAVHLADLDAGEQGDMRMIAPLINIITLLLMGSAVGRAQHAMPLPGYPEPVSGDQIVGIQIMPGDPR